MDQSYVFLIEPILEKEKRKPKKHMRTDTIFIYMGNFQKNKGDSSWNTVTEGRGYQMWGGQFRMHFLCFTPCA
jgi:hypothetical protein